MKLEPCPFCGESDGLNTKATASHSWIACAGCSATGPMVAIDVGFDPDAAAVAWNRSPVEDPHWIDGPPVDPVPGVITPPPSTDDQIVIEGDGEAFPDDMWIVLQDAPNGVVARVHSAEGGADYLWESVPIPFHPQTWEAYGTAARVARGAAEEWARNHGWPDGERPDTETHAARPSEPKLRAVDPPTRAEPAIAPPLESP